jgi:uncharacterized protein (TIGR02285 family)
MRRQIAINSALLLVAFPLSKAVANDTVHWMRTDFPPMYIETGEGAGTGIGDKSERYLFTKMPEFEHVVLDIPIPRMYDLIAEEDGYCFSAAFHDAGREGVAVFTDSYLVGFPNQLITTTEKLQALRVYQDPSGAVLLDRLVQDKSLAAGVTIGRSYGPQIDGPIRALKERGGDQEISSIQNLFRLLDMGRIDYTFAYPVEMTFYSRTVEKKFQAVPVVGATASVAVNIACSNKPIGRRVVARINEIIRQNGDANPFLQFEQDWLDDSHAAKLPPMWKARDGQNPP